MTNMEVLVVVLAALVMAASTIGAYLRGRHDGAQRTTIVRRARGI